MSEIIATRAWSMDDLADLLKHADNFKVASQLRDRFPHPYKKADGISFLEKHSALRPVQNFAITLDNTAIGAIGLVLQDDIHRKNAEIGYWLGETFWGLGIMKQVIPGVVRHGFDHFDIDRIFAVVSHRNLASQKVLQYSGFRLEARLESTLFKLGEYHDELIFAIRRKK